MMAKLIGNDGAGSLMMFCVQIFKKIFKQF